MPATKTPQPDSKSPNPSLEGLESANPPLITYGQAENKLRKWQRQVRAAGMYALIFWATVVMVSEMLKHFKCSEFSDGTFISMHITLCALVVGYIALCAIIKLECATRLNERSICRDFTITVALLCVIVSTIASLIYAWGRFEWDTLYAVYSANCTLFAWSFFIVAVVWFASPSPSEK